MNNLTAPVAIQRSFVSRLEMCISGIRSTPEKVTPSIVSGTYPGWWFGTMELYDFPYIGNNHPN